jgi:hypothetical protein
LSHFHAKQRALDRTGTALTSADVRILQHLLLLGHGAPTRKKNRWLIRYGQDIFYVVFDGQQLRTILDLPGLRLERLLLSEVKREDVKKLYNPR